MSEGKSNGSSYLEKYLDALSKHEAMMVGAEKEKDKQAEKELNRH